MYMKRQEIDTSLTWDLTAMFANQTAFETTYAKAKEKLRQLLQRKGHIADDKSSYRAFMEALESVYRQIDDLITYANMMADADPKQTYAQQNLAAASQLEQLMKEGLAFYEQEILDHQAQIEVWLQDDDCRDFRYPMEEIFRTAPHRRSAEVEELLTRSGSILRVPSDTYSSFRLSFTPVNVDGKAEFLNGGTYRQFLHHPQLQVRKDAFYNYHKEYERYQDVFYQLLSGHAKGQVLEAKTRHFPSALEASLFEDGADKQLYEKVLMMANVKHHAPLHSYFTLRKELLQMEEQHVYDISLPLVKSIDKQYTIEECFTILNQALAPLGDDYIAMLDTAKKQRWIDFMPCEDKRSGAYSSGTHDSYPYILTNFTGSYDSLSTLAHEFGHSMHSWYSHQHNRPLLSGYRIFVAEVASTVNELLLNEYLLQHAKDDTYRAYLLDNLLTQLIGTLYRQPMYARFESQLHDWIEDGVSFSSKELTQYFLDINKEYFGTGVEVDDLFRYGCYTIPHFYYNFYVYKYTLGMAVAIAFTKKIIKGDVAAYREFLTKGGSEAPIDELIHADVDPRSDVVYDEAFHYFADILQRFRELMQQGKKA